MFPKLEDKIEMFLRWLSIVATVVIFLCNHMKSRTNISLEYWCTDIHDKPVPTESEDADSLLAIVQNHSSHDVNVANVAFVPYYGSPICLLPMLPEQDYKIPAGGAGVYGILLYHFYKSLAEHGYNKGTAGTFIIYDCLGHKYKGPYIRIGPDPSIGKGLHIKRSFF